MTSKSRGARQPGRSEKSTEANDAPRILSPAKQEQRARNVLLYQLARGAKSAHTLRTILEKREIEPQIAEAVIQRFIEVGLIDDAAFAETLVNSKLRHKGLARSAIKRELSGKGVAAEIVEQAIAQITPESEMSMAIDLAKHRAQRMAHLDHEVRQRRLSGYLARKGYSSSVIVAALKEAETSLIHSK